MRAGIVAAIIGGVAGLLVAVVQMFAARDSRGRAQKEADVLSKLDPDSDAAKLLREIIEQRIARWHRRMVAPDRLAEALAESMKPGPGPVGRRIWRIWVPIGAVSLTVLTLGITSALNYRGGASTGSGLCLLGMLLCP